MKSLSQAIAEDTSQQRQPKILTAEQRQRLSLMAELRRLRNELQEEQQFLQWLQKLGYRFIAAYKATDKPIAWESQDDWSSNCVTLFDTHRQLYWGYVSKSLFVPAVHYRINELVSLLQK